MTRKSERQHGRESKAGISAFQVLPDLKGQPERTKGVLPNPAFPRIYYFSLQKEIIRLIFLINNKQQIRSFHEMINTNEDINKLPKKINYFSIPENFTGLITKTTTYNSRV